MGWGGRRLWTDEDVLVLQGVGKFRFSSCYDIPYMMCVCVKGYIIKRISVHQFSAGQLVSE